MVRGAQLGVLVAVLLAAAGCGTQKSPAPATPGSTGAAAPKPAPAPKAAAPQRTVPPVDPTQTPKDAASSRLLKLLVPKGAPTASTGERADPQQLAVVQRWLQALTNADIPAAADTFADGAIVQNAQAPTKLVDRAARIAFNRSFPCGAEVSAASSVRGYLIVVYQLTDRKGSGCDGPGGTAASTIKVTGGRMTEWYRLPDPPSERSGGAGQVS
jgi:hypothetical protein